MKLKGIIVDADFCIKVGASPKYRYLERVLTGLADKVYIHKIVYDEIMIPACAKEQIDFLRKQGIIEILDENILKSHRTSSISRCISVFGKGNDKSEKTEKKSRRDLFSGNS